MFNVTGWTLISSVWKVGIEEGHVQCDWLDTVSSMWKMGIEEGHVQCDLVDTISSIHVESGIGEGTKHPMHSP